MDRGNWGATVHRVTKSQTRLKQLSMCAHTHRHTHKQKHSQADSWTITIRCIWNSMMLGWVSSYLIFKGLSGSPFS